MGNTGGRRGVWGRWDVEVRQIYRLKSGYGVAVGGPMPDI